METEISAPKRRVVTRYSAADRERLMKEQAESGLSKAAFCAERGINLGTFHGWAKRRRERERRRPAFVEGQLPIGAEGAPVVEVLLPNGVRIAIRHGRTAEELVALIRALAGMGGARGC